MEAETERAEYLTPSGQPYKPVSAREGWDADPVEPGQMQPRITAEERDAWSQVRSEVRDLAREQNDLPMGQTAVRIGLSGATFSAWYAGKYKGSYGETTAKVRKWMEAYSEQREAGFHMREEPAWVETPTALRVMTTLVFTQSMGGMAIVTLGSGMGKSTVVRRFLQTRPHAFHLTVSPSTRKVSSLMRALASAVGAPSSHPGNLQTVIGEKLQRNGRQTLLMVDEAQNLDDDAVNQLRHFSDNHGCGVVLLGNEDAFKRWAAGQPREGYGQVHSRFDDRVRILKPQPGDIEKYIGAWGLTDPAVVKLLTKIGQHPGALRQISKTIRIASIVAGRESREIAADDIAAAWSRRSNGEVL